MVMKTPFKVLTIRLPPELHEKIKQEAFLRKISINRLCVEVIKKELKCGESVLQTG